MQKRHSLTDFGKKVRKRQIDLGITQVELAELVRLETGCFMDPQYLQKILCGIRRSPKTVLALEKILSIQESEVL